MWTALKKAFARKAPERRHSPRVKWELPIVVLTANGGRYTGVTRDYSQDGVGAVISAELPLGSEAVVLLQLPDGSPQRRIRAIVRQRTGVVYGLEFLE